MESEERVRRTFLWKVCSIYRIYTEAEDTDTVSIYSIFYLPLQESMWQVNFNKQFRIALIFLLYSINNTVIFSLKKVFCKTCVWGYDY